MEKLRTTLSILLAAAALSPTLAMAASPTDDTSTPLKPVGQWLVEGQDNMCALSHDYGEGGARVTLALRPHPIGETEDILLFTRSNGGVVQDGHATVQVDGGPASEPSDYVSYALTQGGRRLLSFRVPAAALDGLGSSARFTLAIDRRKQIVIDSGGFARGLAALAGCQKLLRAQLGIDMNEQARIAAHATAKSPPALWFSPGDYPEEALHGGAEGVSRLLLTIGTDGRISRCVTFGSSGNAAMDKTACRKFIERGRYTPATDASGKPMVEFDETAVHWRQG